MNEMSEMGKKMIMKGRKMIMRRREDIISGVYFFFFRGNLGGWIYFNGPGETGLRNHHIQL